MKNIFEALHNVRNAVLMIMMLTSAAFGFGTSYALIQMKIINVQVDIQKLQTEIETIKLEVQKVQIESARRDECIKAVQSGINEIKVDVKKLVFDRRF